MTPADEQPAIMLARIETKLDTALHQGADHEQRIRALEAARWPLPAAAVLLSVGAFIIPLVSK